MTLEKLHHWVGQQLFLSKVDILAFSNPDKNLKELKSNDCVVVIVVLILLFVIGCLEVSVNYSTVHFLVRNASVLTKMKESRLFHFSVTNRDYSRHKYLHQIIIPQFNEVANWIVCVIISANLFDLPVLGIVDEAISEGFFCILFPVFENGEFLLKRYWFLFDLQDLSEGWDLLCSDVRQKSSVVPSKVLSLRFFNLVNHSLLSPNHKVDLAWR